jgi:hypothetical protein
MIVAFRLSAGIAALALGFYWFWLWLQDWQAMTLLIAVAFFSGGALSLLLAWSWQTRGSEWPPSVSRPRTGDPSEGLEGAGWREWRRR